MKIMLMVSLLVSLAGYMACEAAEGPTRYWPQFVRPAKVLLIPMASDHEEAMTYECAAGLAARAVSEGRWDTMLGEDLDNSGYQEWLAQMLAQTGAAPEPLPDQWAAVGRVVDAGLVKGYVLFSYDRSERGWFEHGEVDQSANVATSLAGLWDAVAVSDRFEEKAKELGLTLLADVRGKDELWCLKEYGEAFTRDFLASVEPRCRLTRSLAVAEKAFCCSGYGEAYKRGLERCKAPAPVLGWGIGGEDQHTLPSSQWGLFQSATNWCHNLPLFSTEQVGKTLPADQIALPAHCRVGYEDLDWESGVHYTTFLMSDGDNVQWLMGNFCGGAEAKYYWNNPARGQFAFGWTLCYVDLAQLCPYTLVKLMKEATPNDDFVLYGGGYYYPDYFGEKRETNVLADHAAVLRQYMALGGLKTLAYNAKDWDGEKALHAYTEMVQGIPELAGLLTVQYYPYSGGEGHILWVRRGEVEVPVISARLCLWANTGRPRDTTPAGVAKWLSEMPTGGATWTEDNFSFVMPHCWSYFRDTAGDPSITAEEEGNTPEAEGVSRGLLPVQWCVERLRPEVRVVTPTRLVLLVNLHLRTRQTLSGWLDQLALLAVQGDNRLAQGLIKQAQALLPSVQDGDESGKQCFELAKRAALVLEEAGVALP